MHTIELTDVEWNTLVTILGRHTHSDGAMSVLDKLKPRTYSIGDRFNIGGNIYILCSVSNCRVGLINVETGARRENSGIYVEEVYKVPYEVVKEIAARDFEKVMEE